MTSDVRSAMARQRAELRLAQLTDDNAFVDVDAVLGTSSTLRQHGAVPTSATRSATASSQSRTRGGPLTSSAGASASTFLDSHDDLTGTVPSSSSAAATALLESRVALSAHLTEQHKAYLKRTDSVRKLTVALLDEQDDASDSEDGGVDETETNKADPINAGELYTRAPTHASAEGDTVEDSEAGKRRGGRGVGSKRKRALSPQLPTSTPWARPTASSPILAASLLTSWSGRQPLVTTASAARTPSQHLATAADSSSSSPTCLCGASAEDVLRAARHELVLLEQWKQWMTSPPPESALHRLAQNPSKTDNALLVPSWQETSLVPWPILAHYTQCPSSHALTAAPPDRLPFAASHVGELPSSITTQPLSAEERREENILAMLGLAPEPLREGCDGARQNHLCAVCLLPAAYRCVRCKTALFCSIDCHVVHDATRCLKFMA